MAVLCGMPTIQYSARNARLSVHKLFTSFIRRGLVSRDLIVDAEWLPATEWCQRYTPCCQPASNAAAILRRFLVRSVVCTGQGNDFELIPTLEIETRNTVEGYFGREFPTMCNQCGVMAAWSRKTLNIFENFFAFFGKTTPYGKFSKILFRKFSSRHRSTCCVQISKFGRLEIGESVRCISLLSF